MSIELLVKKEGMTTIFDGDGAAIPVTVLSHHDAQHIVAHKTESKDGYNAVQISGGKAERKPTKPMQGHFAKAGVAPTKSLYEVSVSDFEGMDLGTEITLESISSWTFIDVQGTSKGKGFSGVMKAHNFAGQRASHGNSLSHRAPGSIGQCQDPGRVFPGKKMAKRLGGVTETLQSLKVVKVDVENKLVIVKGSVPGPKGGYVLLKQALKKGGE